MRKVAVLQSAYIPWRGYFDLIASVDEFIIYDDVQFSHGDWRNRNIIKTPKGPKWLTVPVPKKHRIRQNICNIESSDPNWGASHWARISDVYKKAPYFGSVAPVLKPLFFGTGTNISQINAAFIGAICDFLKIQTTIKWSWDYPYTAGKTRRLVELCKDANCSTYVSGPAAQSYLDLQDFRSEGINVEWFSYNSLREYPQINGPFVNTVSTIDLLFNCGPESVHYIPALVNKK